MRLRIRGPNGQSTVTLDDSSTVEVLRQTISRETSLSAFEIKFGYPPRALPLNDYPAETKLSDLEVKLNGEQLIVSGSEHAPAPVSPAPVVQPPSSREQKPGASAGMSRPTTGAARPQDRPNQASDAKTQSSSGRIPLTRKSKFEKEEPPEIILPELGGTLVLRIMPDDNSCLFRAIATAVFPGLDTMTELRSMVAQRIQAQPDKYSKAVLDNQNPDDYCRWIQTEDAWGGQIELDVLSQQLGIEICSIDVQSLRVDRYNEHAQNRCIVVYSGIHYDTIALSLFGSTPDADIKVFESHIKDEVLPEAVALCQKLQDKHYFTDTARMGIKCNDCGATLTGEKGAAEHATTTGHRNLVEIQL